MGHRVHKSASCSYSHLHYLLPISTFLIMPLCCLSDQANLPLTRTRQIKSVSYIRSNIRCARKFQKCRNYLDMGESGRKGTLRSCSELGNKKVRLRQLRRGSGRGEGRWMVGTTFRCCETAKRLGQDAQSMFHVFVCVCDSLCDLNKYPHSIFCLPQSKNGFI